MKFMVTLAVMTACGVFAIGSMDYRAQAQQLPANLQGVDLYELDKATRSLSATARADAFAGWMAANDWRSMNLALHHLYNLYSFVNADSVDRRHFSARWTGFITAPTSGTYTLRQVQQYSGADSRLKVSINSQTVLDSTDSRAGDNRFKSQPIELTASHPVPIQVVMTHDVPQIEVSEGAPMVVLTWKIGDAKEAIIPASAFNPPEGFGEGGAHGLKGEYFADLAFKDLKSTRLDPALDIVSTWPPIAPIHQAESSAVFEACKAKLMDDAYLAQAAINGPDFVFRRSLWRIAYRMRAIERQQLVQKLLSHPEIMQGMTPGTVARLMQAFFMLPSKDHLTLVGQWAIDRPQPRYQVLPSPVVATGAYENTVYDDYWRLGHVLQGPYWSDVQTLWANYLVRPTGECNLPIAYMTAYATREESFRRDGRFVHVITDRIKQALDDQTLAGDKRVTWLFARVFANEVLYSGRPLVSPRSEYLSEARLVAESSDYKSWTLQEIVARYASQGNLDDVNKTIGDFAGDNAEQQAALAVWRNSATAIAAAAVQLRADDQAKSIAALIADVQNRLAVAQQSSNQEEIARWQKVINTLQTSQTKP